MKNRHFKLVLIAVCSLLLTACANRTSMYQWGNYDTMLYQSYKNPDTAVGFRQGLEVHIANMEQSRQKVAPGLYAELGTMYLQAGDSIKATAMYRKEGDAWPESKGLMETLIKNIARRIDAKIEVQS